MTPQGQSWPDYWCFLGERSVVQEEPDRFCIGELVSPRLWYQFGTAPPLELLGRLQHRGRFRPGYPLLWIESANGALRPYWVPRPWSFEVGKLRAGEPAPLLPPDVTGALYAIGAIVAEQEAPLSYADAAAALARDGYVTVRGLIDVAHLASLQRYYRALFANGAIPLGDSQCPLRFGVHDESMARFFQDQFTPAMSRIVGARVRPSYTYSVGYQVGATLDRHTDREECEFTVSLLIDSGHADGTSAWPIWLATAVGDVAVRQSVGDALVFAGRRLAHWRDPLVDGGPTTSLLLHYVFHDLAGSLC